MKMTCKDVVKERGLDKITVEDLVQVSISIKYFSIQIRLNSITRS